MQKQGQQKTEEKSANLQYINEKLQYRIRTSLFRVFL